MNIQCKAEYYTCQEGEKEILVTNSLYDAKIGMLLLTAVCELFIPDIYQLNLPLVLKIKPKENSDVVIDKKLNVSGAETVEYFVLRDQWSKWRKSYLVSGKIMVGLELILAAFLVYCTVMSGSIGLALCSLIVLALVGILSYRLFRNCKKAKQYRMIDNIAEIL